MKMRLTIHATAATTMALILGATACSKPSDAHAAMQRHSVVLAAAFPAPTQFSYLDLFPFRDLRGALAWEAAYRNGGHAPWHLSADLTALAFTQGFLHFGGINAIASRHIRGTDAAIGVGFRNPDGRISTAAILHLRKLGTGPDAPWEVVGSNDTDLTITRPGYGDHVAARFTTGGAITGVDESLHLWVRGLSSDRPLGEMCCVGAGGNRQPWTAVVRFRSGPDRVLTVIVATGERFAITAVRTG